MQTPRKTQIVLFVMALFAAPIHAHETPKRRPPLEAIQACEKKAAAQECEFTAPRGKILGKCAAPEGKPLACKPNNRPNANKQK